MRISARSTSRSTALLMIAVALSFAILFLTHLFHGTAIVLAAEIKAVQLPKPEMTGGMPLMAALRARRTTRAFADKPLPPQELSNLLWAAFGVNRKGVEWQDPSGQSRSGRTAPSAVNNHDIAIYVSLKDGVYLYQAEQNRLDPVVTGDVRSQIESPPGGPAAVVLIYVAPANDGSAQVDSGFIGQNVYLFAASEGLNAWFYALHGQNVSGILRLPADRRVLFEQSVGYPPK
jgi:nitroreductase